MLTVFPLSPGDLQAIKVQELSIVFRLQVVDELLQSLSTLRGRQRRNASKHFGNVRHQGDNLLSHLGTLFGGHYTRMNRNNGEPFWFQLLRQVTDGVVKSCFGLTLSRPSDGSSST